MDPKQPGAQEVHQGDRHHGDLQGGHQRRLASWFAKVQPQLAANQSIGYDLMVITNGIAVQGLRRARATTRRSTTRKMPNFTANAGAEVQATRRSTRATSTACRGRPASPASRYNPKYVKTPPTSLQDLRNPTYKGKIGMFSDTEEIGNFGMLAVGVDPETSTPDDWQQGRRLAQAAAATPASSASTTTRTTSTRWPAATSGSRMAWSGDIFQKNVVRRDRTCSSSSRPRAARSGPTT